MNEEDKEQKTIPVTRVVQKYPFPSRARTREGIKHACHAIIILVLFFLTGCTKHDENKPEEVRWDRETCARCAMAISDRSFSAQIRGGNPEQQTKLYKFDDIGCALVWLDKQNWKDDNRTKIWVNDHRNGDWIDAKTAWYVKVKYTPMDYGLGAQSENEPDALNFAEADAYIDKEENHSGSHSGHSDPASPLTPTQDKEVSNQ